MLTLCLAKYVAWCIIYVYFKVKELSITLQALIARTTIGETTGKYQYKLIKAFVI